MGAFEIRSSSNEKDKNIKIKIYMHSLSIFLAMI
jgi:hypothetical protein